MSALDEARAAVGLLTIVPVGRRPLPEAASAGAAPWLPLVGGLIGVVAATAYALGETLLGGFYGAALALAAAAILTGALHHDGLADMADGLGVRGDAARRLQVMRDSTIGTYGTLALVAYALLCRRAQPLQAPDAVGAIVCGHVLGRWAALVQLALSRPRGPDGLGAAFGATHPGSCSGRPRRSRSHRRGRRRRRPRRRRGAAIAAAATTFAARRLVGGRTGDTLGAAVLVTEVVVVSLLAAYWLA